MGWKELRWIRIMSFLTLLISLPVCTCFDRRPHSILSQAVHRKPELGNPTWSSRCSYFLVVSLPPASMSHSIVSRGDSPSLQEHPPHSLDLVFSSGRMLWSGSSGDMGRPFLPEHQPPAPTAVGLSIQRLSSGWWEARGHGWRWMSASSVLTITATISQCLWDVNGRSGACWKEHVLRSKRVCVLARWWLSLHLLIPHVWNVHIPLQLPHYEDGKMGTGESIL